MLNNIVAIISRLLTLFALSSFSALLQLLNYVFNKKIITGIIGFHAPSFENFFLRYSFINLVIISIFFCFKKLILIKSVLTQVFYSNILYHLISFLLTYYMFGKINLYFSIFEINDFLILTLNLSLIPIVNKISANLTLNGLLKK